MYLVREDNKLVSHVHDEFRDVEIDIPLICHFWPKIQCLAMLLIHLLLPVGLCLAKRKGQVFGGHH